MGFFAFREFVFFVADHFGGGWEFSGGNERVKAGESRRARVESRVYMCIECECGMNMNPIQASNVPLKKIWMEQEELDFDPTTTLESDINGGTFVPSLSL